MLLWSVVPTVVKHTIHKEDLQCNHSLLWNKIFLFLPKMSDYTDSKIVHFERDSYVLSSSSYHASFFCFHLTLMLIPHAPFKGWQLSFCVSSYIVLSLLMRMLLISFTSPYEFHFIFYSVYLCFCSFCLITLFCLWTCLLSFLAPLSFLSLLFSLIRTTPFHAVLTYLKLETACSFQTLVLVYQTTWDLNAKGSDCQASAVCSVVFLLYK